MHPQETDRLVMMHEALVWEMHDALQHGCILMRRVLVEHLPEIGKLYVYGQDHYPVHFHLQSKKYDAVFDLATGRQLKGKTLSKKEMDHLQHWLDHLAGRSKLTLYWNRCNPDKAVSLST